MNPNPPLAEQHPNEKCYIRLVYNMTKFKTILLFILISGLMSCGRSPSNSEEKATSTQPETVKSERSKPTENYQKQPEPKDDKVSQSTIQPSQTPESNSSPTSPPQSENSQNTKTSPADVTTKPDRPAIKPEYNFKPDEEPIVPVGNFEFQLKQASLKKELVDPSTQKSYSAKSAEKPSYYLFVELDLTNRSDRTAFDLFRYQLDCGDEKPIENAADAAIAYRTNQNLNLFAEIQPGETGTVADGFLVPESCLNSDQITLNISSAGEGKGEIPIRLK
jgi:hypothetical protein